MKSNDFSTLTNVKMEKKCCEKLKAEAENITSELLYNGLCPNSELMTTLDRIKFLISFCVSESEDIETINTNFEDLRKEKDGYKLQAKRLAEENKWLREELRSTQDKLQQKEMDFVEIEENNKSLKFLVELQNNPSLESNIPVRITKPNDSSLTNGTSKVNPDSQSSSSQPNTGLSGMSTSMITSNCSSSQNPHLLPIQEVPPRLKTLHNLVIQYARQGRYEIAIPLCKQTLNDLEQASGHYHADVATMLNILALVYRDKGDFEEAVENLTEALEIRKKILGPDSPRVAATLNNLSVLYAKQNNHAEAEPLCRDALKIREEVLGNDHPDVARQLNNLALLCQNQGKYEEVDKYYRRALSIYIKNYPSNDANIIKTKNNLASSCLKQNKVREAESILKEILNDAHDREWSGCERDTKSKPIWIIADERERSRNLSMSMDTINTCAVNNSTIKSSTDNTANNSINNHTNNASTTALNDTCKGDNPPPPYGFDIKHKNKEDKIALLTTLKLLSNLYRRENKVIASDIIDEWLAWAGKSLSKYQLDVRWLSYESSLIQSDLYNNSLSQYRSQTLWYPTPSPTHIPSLANNQLSKTYLNNSTTNVHRSPSSALNTTSNATSPFLLLDSHRRSIPKPSKIPINTDFIPIQSNISTDLSDNVATYLYKNTINQSASKSKYESEKSNIYDNIDKS